MQPYAAGFDQKRDASQRRMHFELIRLVLKLVTDRLAIEQRAQVIETALSANSFFSSSLCAVNDAVREKPIGTLIVLWAESFRRHPLAVVTCAPTTQRIPT